jgi:hypothetical protein
MNKTCLTCKHRIDGDTALDYLYGTDQSLVCAGGVEIVTQRPPDAPKEDWSFNLNSEGITEVFRHKGECPSWSPT